MKNFLIVERAEEDHGPGWSNWAIWRVLQCLQRFGQVERVEICSNVEFCSRFRQFNSDVDLVHGIDKWPNELEEHPWPVFMFLFLQVNPWNRWNRVHVLTVSCLKRSLLNCRLVYALWPPCHSRTPSTFSRFVKTIQPFFNHQGTFHDFIGTRQWIRVNESDSPR